MQIEIRKATPDDIDWLLEELRKFAEFFETKRSMFGNEEYARSGLLRLVTQHIVFVAEKFSENAEPLRVGFIAGFLMPHIFNPEIRVLCETFWWVTPEHRSSRAGAMLLRDFIDYGQAAADWVTLALEAKSPVREETLLKRGFKLYEKSYLLEN